VEREAHARAAHGELQPMERTHAGAAVEHCLLWEGSHAGAGAESEEEGAADSV